ncbi:Glucosamine-phosphate N-acetyltransferase-like protein [Candidozyma auris]|uniref:Glucosamine 6-phosphate N-acetyltransferase n=1 Tax=Candidozyma auris TaxID=498019 RepID=A0A2H0ZF06_CANAR|nr:glucosamine 6-phosphate N-acetyltransferase [[Candida] auris]KND99469.2 gna1 glucosamine-6-phosphate acetyltransferase [[Candida] auris]PIS48628.1 hypothetical protein B9J08_005328 [[Candida] auris]PIS49240.1 hypothetical protein CJI97_005411 [[Candida] auris]PSK75730.1 hypothetical protein CJJ07_004476 [[Candida] auris]QEL61871.1 hypothetical protein CJJ09_004029 [[Candida] auris]
MPLPKGYTVRAPAAKDHLKYTETLKVLTKVGDITPEQFQDVVYTWEKNPEIYFPRVIVDESDTVVATGMLVVEQKIIHACGKVGHIEDIAVSKSEQGKRLGDHMISMLTEIAKEQGCYKVILDCSPENVGFYEKCGYQGAGIEMAHRFD